jgi:hypothetical protein
MPPSDPWNCGFHTIGGLRIIDAIAGAGQLRNPASRHDRYAESMRNTQRHTLEGIDFYALSDPNIAFQS